MDSAEKLPHKEPQQAAGIFNKEKVRKYLLSIKKSWFRFLIIFIAVLSIITFGSFTLVQQKSTTQEQVTLPTIIPQNSTTATPTNEESSNKKIVSVNTPTPSLLSTATPKPKSGISNPTVTSAPASTVTATPTPTSTPTSTPVPADTTQPTLDYMTGPEDGAHINFNNFCFPMKASDNRTSSQDIVTMYIFDGVDSGNWAKNYAYCFSNVANGSHTFRLIFKDEAGNSNSVIRQFTVQL